VNVLSLAIVLGTVTAAAGHADIAVPAAAGRPGAQPHPAVARIITPQRDGVALGSGTLVAVNETKGLVVTNYHVVEDAAGPITVAFPDGFRSAATVLKADRDWDLAALVIWRPSVAPVPLASQSPRPGDPLTIAGYGSGDYRAATGRCTQYVSPGKNRPFEMVELGTPARQGDSGGPILNSRGELAGVLFGTDGGSTTGSYCGRVRSFLTSILGEPEGPQPNATLVAQRSPPTSTGPAVQARSRPSELAQAPVDHAQPLAAFPASPSRSSNELPGPCPVAVPGPNQPPSPNPQPKDSQAALPPAPEPSEGDVIGGTSRAEQLKTILAVIGLLAILFHGLRFLSRMSPTAARETTKPAGTRRGVRSRSSAGTP
jgi:hypothetical protein